METMNIITQTLERVRRKLIDLSRRNNLINFRETRRTIKTIDEQADTVFKMLVSGGNPLEFLPFEPEEEEQEEQTQIAKQNSLPLVVQSDQKITTDNQENNKEVSKETVIDTNISDKKTIDDSAKAENKKPPNSIQTPLLAQQLERRCKNLVRHWRTGIEEAGINYLYLAMGFLEWRDSDDSDVRNEAPLILVPLIIERTRLNRQTKCYSYVIRYSGEDIETNLSLSEKLEHDFGLILPDIPEKPKPEEYIKMVGEVIKKKANWHVNGDMKVGFFSFAKLRLYKDLDDNVWPKGRRLTEHPIVKDILIGKESSEGSELRGYADDYEIDKYSFEEKTPLITDADSSQNSAIIDVLLYDKNIVIEGPPGTGKSQTITNLIGAALHQDKSVLFVSEKKAALEVVRNRLDALGLGDFCLELHSYKTQKGLLHKDLEKRLNSKYQDAMQLDNEIKDFKYERDRLQKYYDLLKQKPAKTGESIYEIFWAAERWKEQAGESYINLLISNPLDLGRIQSNKCIEALEDFVSSLSELPKEVRQIWEGFDAKRLLPGDDTTLQEHFEAIAAKTTEFVDTLEKNKDECDSRFINNNLNRLRFLTNLNYDILNDPPGDFDRELARTFLEKEAKEALVDLIEQIKLRRGLIGQYEPIIIADHSWSEKELKDIKVRSQKISSLKLTDRTFNQLKELAPLTENIDQSFQQLHKEIENVRILYSDYPLQINEYGKVVAIANLIESATSEIILHAHSGHAMKICTTIYDEAYRDFLKLAKKIEEQASLFFIDKLPSHKEINELAERFFQKKKSIKRSFSSDYRDTKKKIREFLTHKKNIKRKDLPEILSEIASIQKEIHQFNENDNNKKILGVFYKGMSSEWDRLGKMINWSQKLTKSIGSEERAKEILSDFPHFKEKVQSSKIKIKKILQSIIKKLNMLNIKVSKDTKTAYLRSLAQEINQEIKDLSQIFPEDPAINNLEFQEIINASVAGLNLAKLERDLDNDQRYPRWFATWYQGFDTQVEILESNLEWISRLIAEGGFYSDLVSWLLTDNYESKISLITLIGTTSIAYFPAFDSFLDLLSKYGNLDFDKWIECPKEEAKIKQIQDKITNCTNKMSYIIAWSDYCAIKNQVKDLGLIQIAKKIERNALNKEDAISLFRSILYQSMAKEIMKKFPDLASFRRASFDNIRERISELDQSILSRSRKRIAFRIDQRPVPMGIGQGYVRDYTDLSLIRHELGKKKRHIPIRQLVRRSGKALQALKPCFMMSPQSVAQYLVPGETEFDLVLMDEASQLKLEDAIGAVARSKQISVVGDPKQLPPTTFFERLIEADQEIDETTAAEEAESILDVCQNCFDKRRLRWHYRSEHEQLISFSNHEFYDGDLIVFPSPNPKDRSYGVQYHFVEGGYYKKRRNRVEAEHVARAVIDHVQHNSGLSLGVATFNLEQRDLIHDILERLQKENPWLERAFKKHEDSEYPFFIKNLENVQGDERDVIFISTTYGPEQESGRVYQRFGPINSPVGWRRLNVIVTRAKRRLVIYTSMHSSQVKAVPGSSRGVIALKKYLEFAETGKVIDLGSPTEKGPDSDFEIAVAKQLNDRGYKTSYQIGVAGFFIDIGVHNPFNEGEFILGIECDGAAYHSAKSIRDRDILRQRILESKGWKIYRIWSTDWFKNKERELNNLLKHIEDIIESERVKVEKVQPEKEKQAAQEDLRQIQDEIPDQDSDLRQELLTFRKTKIEPVCEDIECSILSDAVISEFINKKPTTHEEFHSFPYSLRAKIASGQTQYLDEIYEIIEEYVV